MNNNWFMTQQNETYINDISGITDTESFINFMRVAFDTNPVEMCLGAILIIVVSVYIYRKTSCFVQECVKKQILKRM